MSGRHAAPVARVRTITACRGSSKESKTAVAASVPSVQRPDRRGTCVAHQIRSFSWNSGVARSRCFHNRQLTPNALSTDTSVDSTTPSVSETTPNETGAPLRYEIVKGALVRWSHEKPEGPHPATCVLIHGILGSRRNLLSFAKRLAVKFPSWQFVLVDLRCHGQTASLQVPPPGDNDVTSAARDVLATLNKLKIYPNSTYRAFPKSGETYVCCPHLTVYCPWSSAPRVTFTAYSRLLQIHHKRTVCGMQYTHTSPNTGLTLFVRNHSSPRTLLRGQSRDVHGAPVRQAPPTAGAGVGFRHGSR